MTQSDDFTNGWIAAASCVALAFALIQFVLVSKVQVSNSSTSSTLLNAQALDDRKVHMLSWVSTEIANGAKSFLFAEYSICAVFIVVFGLIIFGLISWGQKSAQDGALTALAFVLGAVTSMASGYIGMMVAVYGNVRTTVAAQRGLSAGTGAVSMTPRGWSYAFNTAFRSGGVMGFALSGLGLLVLFIILSIYKTMYDQDDWDVMMEIISGYGLGGSSIAMFGRVGGGIYTKAADVGADLVGKVENNIPEDDPRNPATIADNVGDNVGDVAGMGADLFGSFAESTCAALVLASQSPDLKEAGWGALMFPLLVSGFGIFVCLISSFLATNIKQVRSADDVELALKLQLVATTVLMVPVCYALSVSFLPKKFDIDGVTSGGVSATNIDAFVCVISGCIGGLVIGLITEYYTSFSYTPTREVSDSCRTGAATNIIYGMSLGYKSAIIPVLVLAVIIWVSFKLCDLYGVALAACGMLSTLATGLTIDGYGPVCDNAGGIAEMAELPESVRDTTDALDALGNTTAATGKGFAIGSAVLTSISLMNAFSVKTSISGSLDDPIVLAGALLGAMLPFLFAALTMLSVQKAAGAIIMVVRKQFREKPGIMDGSEQPDHNECVAISTQSSIEEMILPGAVAVFVPFIIGFMVGPKCLLGVLGGTIVSGACMAIMMSNAGGAWDNAKKYIEIEKAHGGKGTDIHDAVVIGDTVGDPFKDTSGPALNILLKLISIIALTLSSLIDGNG
uniref:H(+)-exporting diphosphatase n=1 Tax=Phaeomonas parva TaxID=124430 RepID=A0A7S1TY83_9STRA|mmetsp:Transcript_22618/g.70074  ORF Transcript_22618/g.70074 Transcript_22618/m.70074 type:complete len:736 (+) Transcript_22618:381-2588(+)